MARSKKRARDESSLSDDERVRRDRQRELQRAAVAAHASGEEFVNAEKKKRKPLAARRLAERRERRRVEHAAAKRAVQKEVKKQKAAAPDVVIVPIFWKGEAKQMARVLSACADVEAALADSGRRVMLDGGHKYTPGQKFAHWEHKGVKLRIEIGPREAERACCTLARTFKPGEPATRTQRVPIGVESLAESLDRLAALEEPEEGDEPTGAFADDGGVAALSDAPLAGAGAGGGEASMHRGGDDLDDDFADGDEADGGEEAGVEASGEAFGEADASARLAARMAAKDSKAKKSGSSGSKAGAAARPAKKARTVSF